MRKPSKPKLDPKLAKSLLDKVVEPSPFPGVAGVERTVFDAQKCPHCRGLHSRMCPAVAYLELYESGATKSVTYFPHGHWPADEVIWYEDVIEASAEAEDG